MHNTAMVQEATAARAAHLPPITVADYVATLAEQGECKVSTLEHRLASISQAHQLARYESPSKAQVVRMVMKGIRRDLGVAQTKKTAATIEAAPPAEGSD